VRWEGETLGCEAHGLHCYRGIGRGGGGDLRTV
jgi:hypothetical protein